MTTIGRVGSALSLAFLATALMFAWNVSKASRPAGTSLNLLDNPRHPVTDPMWRQARAVAGMAAPNFTLPDAAGAPVTLLAECKDRPVVLVFTKDGCPCSMESQPFFNALATRLGDRVTFFGVIDASNLVAKKYQLDFKVPYRMILAGDGAVYRSFKAVRSVYTTLVSPGGVVIRQWPGYNRAMLVELEEELGKATHSPPVSIDTTMAPEKMNSGCKFELQAD